MQKGTPEKLIILSTNAELRIYKENIWIQIHFVLGQLIFYHYIILTQSNQLI